MKYIIRYDYGMGHEYRGYVVKLTDGNFFEFCENDGCTEKNAWRFDNLDDVHKYIGNTDKQDYQIISIDSKGKMKLVDDKDEVNNLVRHYALANKESFEDIYNRLYKAYNNLQKVNIKCRAKYLKIRPIEVIEKMGGMPQLLSLAQQMYK